MISFKWALTLVAVDKVYSFERLFGLQLVLTFATQD